MINKIIFLDRDGVINKKAAEHDYIKNRSEFKRNKLAKEFIKNLNDKNYIVVIITNQQGIGRGLFTIGDLENIDKEMNHELNKIGARIDKFYFCPHLKEENCNCRKPKTGMLEKAANEFQIEDKSKMFLIGDSDTDIECANNFGVKSYKIKTDKLENSYDNIIKIL